MLIVHSCVFHLKCISYMTLPSSLHLLFLHGVTNCNTHFFSCIRLPSVKHFLFMHEVTIYGTPIVHSQGYNLLNTYSYFIHILVHTLGYHLSYTYCSCLRLPSIIHLLFMHEVTLSKHVTICYTPTIHKWGYHLLHICSCISLPSVIHLLFMNEVTIYYRLTVHAWVYHLIYTYCSCMRLSSDIHAQFKHEDLPSVIFLLFMMCALSHNYCPGCFSVVSLSTSFILLPLKSLHSCCYLCFAVFNEIKCFQKFS